MLSAMLYMKKSYAKKIYEIRLLIVSTTTTTKPLIPNKLGWARNETQSGVIRDQRSQISKINDSNSDNDTDSNDDENNENDNENDNDDENNENDNDDENNENDNENDGDDDDDDSYI
jgi:hypothetical protein